MELLAKTREWRGQFLRRALWEGLSRIAAWSVALLALGLAADRALALPQAWRLGLWTTAAASFAAAVVLLLVVPFLLFRWDEVLTAAENRHPKLKPFLKTAWDLHRVPGSHTSESLKEEHLRLTDVLLRRLAAGPLFLWTPSAWVMTGAVAAAVGGLSLPMLSDAASWQRLLAPWRDAALESFLSVSPGDRVCGWGEAVSIDVEWKASQRAPGGRGRGEDLRLWLEGQGLSWRQVHWDVRSRDGAGYSVEELTSRVRYRITWKDMTTRTYGLVPAKSPAWGSLQAKVRSPQGAVTTVLLSPAEEVPVLRGSFITLLGEPTEELSEAAVRFSGTGRLLPMKPAAKGGAFSAGFPALEDAVFTFDLKTPDGRTHPEPERYTVRAVEDRPPEARLISPVMPLQASRHDTIPVAYSAKDDVGLSEILLRIRIAGGPEEVVVLRRFKGPPENVSEFFGDHPWDLGGLAHGAKASFQIEARDDAVPPQSALSAKGSIEIVDFESVHAEASRRWVDAEKNVESLGQAHEGLDELLSELGSSAGDKAAAREGLERKLSGLPGAWDLTVRSLSELASAMQADVYSNPGLARRLQALSEDMDRTRTGSVPKELDAARRRDWKAAQEANQRLSAKLGAALSELRAGRSLQHLQDFYSHAGRMSRSADSLESAIEAARQGAGARDGGKGHAMLREAMRRLRAELGRFQRSLAALPRSQPGSADQDRNSLMLPVDRALSQMGALEEAIASGDLEKAARIARFLSESLAQMQRAIGETAAGAMSASGNSPAMEEARRLWSEVVEEQSASLDVSQQIHKRAMAELVEKQRRLLEELAERQRVLVSSAASRGRAFPSGVLPEMRIVQSELGSAQVLQTPARLRMITGRLKAEVLQAPLRSSTSAPAGMTRPDLALFAAEEGDILRLLEGAPKEPPKEPPQKGGDAAYSSAATRQARVRSKTGTLRSSVESLSAKTLFPEGTVERIGQAMTEQGSAEDSLEQGDASTAAHHQEAAMRLLEKGLSDWERSLETQQQNRLTIQDSFSQAPSTVRIGGSGPSATPTGFVPLPEAREFAPPRELREELERSLRERRPKAMDKLIKEYFKRIAE